MIGEGLSVGRRLLLVFGVWLVVVLVGGGLAVWAVSASSDAQTRVEAAARTRLAAADLAKGYVDQETGQRGYVLAGQDAFLQPYSSGQTQVREAVAQIRRSTDRATVRTSLQGAERAGRTWEQIVARQIHLRAIGDVQGAVEAVASQAGKKQFDVLRARLGDLNRTVAAEQGAAGDHQTTVDRLVKAAVGGTLVVALLGAVVVWFLTRRWLTSPIETLTTAVRRAGTDDAAPPITPVGTPEIQRLATDIETMRQNIREQHGELVQTRADVAEQRSVVEALQRALLPPTYASADGFDIAVRYLASSRSTTVGGDWYVVVPLGSGRIGLAIGDVAGHGIGAVADMASSRLTLRGFASEDRGPAEVLAAVNQVACRFAVRGFTTACYLVLDLLAGDCRVALAGHYPPAVIAPDGEVRFLSSRACLPIGVADDAQYVDEHFGVVPGSTVVLYTDGLVERRGDVELDIEQRLVDALQGIGHDPDAVCDRLIERLAPDGADDVALLVVHVDAARAASTSIPG